MERIASYAPVADANCRTLIVGTAPSVESLRAGFFYGHPRNAFWRILAEVFEAELPKTIEDKKALLLKNRVALWDVCGSCEREGSLDSNIRSVEPNDFRGFFERTPAYGACCSTGVRRRRCSSGSAGVRSATGRGPGSRRRARPTRFRTPKSSSGGERN